MAESVVKTVKRLFKKAYKMNEDPYLALLAHRSTPSTNDTMSPAQKLFKREKRTQLPDLRSFISKKTEPAEKQLPAKFHQRIHNKQKQYHDQSAKELPQIPNGATVRIHEKKSWPTKAQVIEKAASPRSYNVQTEENGTFVRGNRRDLLHTKEPFTLQPSEIDSPSNEPKKATTSNLPQPSSYRSRLRGTTNPPMRYGFD